MSQIICLYNAEELGPVVSLVSIERVLRELQRKGCDHPALLASIDTVIELIADGQTMPPLRLSPTVPGGGVQPFVAEIEHTWSIRGVAATRRVR